MKPIGIFFLWLGISVLVFPELVRFLFGTMLLLVGLGILLPDLIFNARKSDGSFRFGDYEILKKKK